MKQTSVIVFVLWTMLFFLQPATAGELNPPAVPDNPAGAMHTVDDLYNRLASGAAGVKRAAGFTEPTANPGSTMRTLNDVMAAMPAADNTDGALPAEVLTGKTFFGLRTDGTWGLATGTLDPGPGAVADNITRVRSQAEFDAIFNQGPGTLIPADSTIVLYPLSGGSYALNNSVRVAAYVSISGVNPHTTRVVKSVANARFELVGTAANPVIGVQMGGWTFDGQAMAADGNGGAFFLQHVRDSILNCHLVDHHANGNGGAIYGENARGIEARFIDNCRAIGDAAGSSPRYAHGGAAYGLTESIITAQNCIADYGGAAANCFLSRVIAKHCHANQGGGGASRCERLRLTATYCTANKRGGGAYYCSDLTAAGYWMNNNSMEGPHIYATNNLTGAEQERHYWRGDYIGRRIDSTVWRTDNE